MINLEHSGNPEFNMVGRSHIGALECSKYNEKLYQIIKNFAIPRDRPLMHIEAATYNLFYNWLNND